MFDLPNLQVDDVQTLADWVELSTLCGSGGLVSRTKIADVLKDSGMSGFFDEEVFPEDRIGLDSDLFSADENADGLSELVWSEIKMRASNLQSGYPFRIEGDIVEREAAPKDLPAFLMLLLVDICRKYSTARSLIPPVASWSRLFEKIVEAAMKGLFHGPTCRFGWPIERGWPTAIDDRIRHLAELVDLQPEGLAGKTNPHDKDKGLDVVCRLSLGNDGAGTVLFITQCAVGENWRSKRGEPSVTEWQDILRWNAQLIRAVAVPWRLDESFDYRRAYRHFDGAMIIDRPRLSFGRPDAFLDSTVSGTVSKWCGEVVSKLPAL